MQIKPRILMVNEFSQLQTGYSTYGNELLTRLHHSGKYDVAELATYANPSDERLRNVKWKKYTNIPHSENQQATSQYQSNPSYQFGEFSFDNVCIDFKPHIVIDIRDFWMMEFEERSPLRKNFAWLIMPTVDAELQHEQWLATYKEADAVLTYTDWSKDLLHKESGGKIKVSGTASPAASKSFVPMNNVDVRKSLGLENYKIIGTVMRNQRRKLYPTLFKAFREYLDETGVNDTILYCHTSYPDMGWDIPRLINHYNLSSKVIFTYVCASCGHAFPNFFNDALSTCKKCGKLSAGLSNVQRGVDDNILSLIINLFDIYIQLSNSEGFGMPQVEAAACGIPVMSTDYSAMSDIVRKLNGFPIDIIDKVPEVETGCLRAIPSISSIKNIWKKFFLEMSDEDRLNLKTLSYQGFINNYNSWDKTAVSWMKILDTIDVLKYESRWNMSPTYKQIEPQLDEDILKRINPNQYAEWIIAKVLCEPDKLGSYMHTRLIRDLNYGVTTGGTGGVYYNDASFQASHPQYQKFGYEEAYNHFSTLAHKYNHVERLRVNQ